MTIKKYLAKTFQEGKLQIINELGEDAIILSTRTTAKSADDEPMVEIVATVEPQKTTENTRPEKEKIAEVTLENPYNSNLARQVLTNLANTTNENKNRGDLHSDILDIKNLITEINKSLKYKFSQSLSPAHSKIYEKLVDAEISDSYALKIIGQIAVKNENSTFEDYLNDARKILTDSIKIQSPLAPTDKKQVVAFLGVSGSGKTMTLIKVAVICKLLYKSRILIVSADNYKVGGADQLQTYSSIASLPFRVVYNTEELNKVIEGEKDYDFILIDTLGKSQNDEKYLKEIKDLLNVSLPDKTILVQNANYSYSTFNQIIRKFSKFNLSSVILTKLDETASIGGVISSIVENNLAISYLSYGQQIPEDIEPASKEKLAKWILPD